MALLVRCSGIVFAVALASWVTACSGSNKGAKEPTKGSASGLDIGFLDDGDRSDLPADEYTKPDKYDPCWRKKCGESCYECDPLDTECVELMIHRVCTSKGACVPAPHSCRAADDAEEKADEKGD